MKVLYINNDGGGFADYIEVPDGTSVAGLFEQRIGGQPDNYLIRVNRQPVAADHSLQQGDRISFTPVKIEGAAPRPRQQVPGDKSQGPVVHCHFHKGIHG